MNNLLIITIAGLCGGVAIGLQAPLSTIISQRLGIMESIFIIHFVGMITIGIPLLSAGGGNLSQWQNLPWYVLLAGSLGLIVVGAQVYIIPSIGVAAAVTLIITGQLLTATLIDNFGFLNMEMKILSWKKTIGLGLVLSGVWLTIKQ